MISISPGVHPYDGGEYQQSKEPTCKHVCQKAARAAEGGGASFNLTARTRISQILLLIEAERKLRGVEVAKQTGGGGWGVEGERALSVNIEPSVCPRECSAAANY